MLRARASNGVFILGLDAENVRNLKDGQPILLSLAELGGKDDIMIVYGETLEAIKKDLEAASGAPIPPSTPLPVSRNIQ